MSGFTKKGMALNHSIHLLLFNWENILRNSQTLRLPKHVDCLKLSQPDLFIHFWYLYFIAKLKRVSLSPTAGKMNLSSLLLWRPSCCEIFRYSLSCPYFLLISPSIWKLLEANKQFFLHFTFHFGPQFSGYV